MHKLFFFSLNSKDGLLFLEIMEKLNKELFSDEELIKSTKKAKHDYKKAIVFIDDDSYLETSGKMQVNLCFIALHLTWCDFRCNLKFNSAAIHLLSKISSTWFYNEHFYLA